ncbi:uncharacterized protein DEA37_0003760 [Paragonimus westermani]|uniref:Uncharacterized protein n=1 Tax=Paragonimus westermani TaxID=34504 RepID=A0A5J4NG88_9TREM|nr:uncharacterized protein DEA37_0003760 [Paragonimus westermani]
MTSRLTPTDLLLNTLREELTRERVSPLRNKMLIQKLKTNIQILKAEFEQLKGREALSTGTKTISDTNAEYQNNLVQNLEAQIETLKEVLVKSFMVFTTYFKELATESDLRMKFEEELNRVQEQLRSFKGLSGEKHIQELKECYDRKLGKALEDHRYTPIIHKISPESNRGSQKSQMFPTSDIDSEAERALTPAEMKDLKEELAGAHLSYETVCSHVLDLQAKLTDMEGKYEASCQMVNEAFQKVAETLELAKQTADERDAAIIEQVDTARELEQLRALVEKLADEAGKRAREEVDKERTQLQMELDRVKSGLEHDFQITRDLDNQISGQLDLRFEHTLQRAHQAEGERDELKLKLETCQLAHERAISCKQQEIEHLLEEQRALKDRLDNAETLRSSVEERLRQQLNAMRTIEQQSMETKRRSETSQRSALQQVLLAHQAAELRDAESKRRIEVLEKTSQQSLQGWREVLGKQQLLVERWKSEAHTLAGQLEQQGIALHAEVERYKAKALQAEKRLEQLEHKKAGLARKRNC